MAQSQHPETDREVSKPASSRRQAANGRDERSMTSGSQAKEMMIEGLSGLNEKIRSLTPESFASTSEVITGKIDELCSYLEDHDPKDALYDAAAIVRRNPLPIALGVAGIGLGVLCSSWAAAKASQKAKASKKGKDLH